MEITIDFKIQLFEYCKSEIEKRINSFTAAMLDAQESANSEDKSSAGDKYETGRAMSQIARDMHAKQLQTAKTDLSNLMQIIPSVVCNKVQKGALVLTSNQQLVFIATSIGLIDFEGSKIAVVSPAAPIAQVLLNKTKGNEVVIAGKKAILKNII
jgi:hypothetical protein